LQHNPDKSERLSHAYPQHIPRFYIGRKYERYEASPLGNPFKIQSEEERPAALEEYRVWLSEHI
jgi:hypothetical protein